MGGSKSWLKFHKVKSFDKLVDIEFNTDSNTAKLLPPPQMQRYMHELLKKMCA